MDQVANWLGNVAVAQSAFRQFLEDTLDKIDEPNIRYVLSKMATAAQDHESRVQDIYHVIGRDPSDINLMMGEMMAKVNETLAFFQGLYGGAVGPWRDIQRLLMINLNSQGAFAVVEQLGLALGLHEIEEITFPIIHEKQTEHIVLQEYMLEMAPVAILYKKDI
ncbi:hypothetical protein [Brevibacillus brevis]|uniref:Uncharacterized protein n=1 Tax=Brevibacillus brevis TaxID=1393 RepID=A0ABY9SYY3_BREBE|nr:hypothetical protein [Brevibacillus brevis]WNC12956.1 hypothetical protein RGB73_19800 [Brevibacillus brevis]